MSSDSKDASACKGRPEPSLNVPPPLPEADKIGWAVAGLGDFAQGYALPALRRARMSKLTGLVSGNASKARDVAARYGIGEDGVYTYDNFSDIRDNENIDVVYLITPNATHCELALKAFEAGKHVMCEKPMAPTPAECQRMIDAAKAADKLLMVAYRAHFEPNNVRVKEMIDAGELGQVKFAVADHHRPLIKGLPRDEWRSDKKLSGGGSLVDIGIYSLNGVIWFFGESPSAVLATTLADEGDERFAEVENLFTAQLVFPSGRRANISSGYTAEKKRIDLFGSEAVAVLDPATSYSGNRLTLWRAQSREEWVAPEPSEAQFVGEMDHLSQAIRNDGDVKTPGEMGLRDCRLIEALYTSANERRWVDLNPDGTMKG